MSTISPDRIRNVAVLGHSHDGKTTLCEAALHAAGATQRLGSTDAGTSILDSEPKEQRRQIGITAGYAHCDWDGHRINLVDTPGTPDFGGQVAEALVAADSAVLCVAANGTVPVGAEIAWERLRAAGLPALVAVTKMDKENAAYEATVDALREAFERKPIAVAVPIGSAEGFRGLVDLVDDRAYEFDGAAMREVDLPGDMREEVERAHSALVDAAAETDDALLEKYLEGTELTDDEVRRALHDAARAGTLLPIVPVASTTERGTRFLLDSIVRYLQSPVEAPRTAVDARGASVEVTADPNAPLLTWAVRTVADPFGRITYLRVLRGTLRPDTHPVNPNGGHEERLAQLSRPMGGKLEPATEVGPGDIAAVTKLQHTHTGDTLCAKEAPLTLPAIPFPPQSYTAAIGARSKGDEDKISQALARQAEEDLTFTIDRDPVTKEVIARGLGDTHLEVTLERIKRRFGVDAVLSSPRIPYRETITGTARVQHKYKKQSGGAGLYGDCTLEIEPLPRGGGFEWQDKIFGGSIPQQFRPSVEKGVQQTMADGALAGYPIVDVRVRLVDGSTHPVDGKDIAFQLAGSMAMRKAVLDARPVILEPVMNVRVVAPDALVGDVIGVVNGHRGRMAGMNPLGDGRSEVNGVVPQAEMHDFPIDLRATTQGRGRYTMELSHYEEVPANIAQPLIDAYRKDHVAAAS
ncbi:MAG TPA: elongation factor G [Candidatus Dormibacteraeota bacterium]|nr:elongation factor G [Candidatus Dormibacteraeota bacterium]